MDQAPGEAEISLVPLWSLMRFLSLRLKPKAAATPRMGRGPGTDAAPPLELVVTLTEMVSPEPSSVQVPRVPEVGIPKDASDMPLKTDLLLMVAPEAYVSSIPKYELSQSMIDAMPLPLDAMPLPEMPEPRVVAPFTP